MTRLEAIGRINELAEHGAVTFRSYGTTYVVDEATSEAVACHPEGQEDDPYASQTLEWSEVGLTPAQLLGKHTPSS